MAKFNEDTPDDPEVKYYSFVPSRLLPLSPFPPTMVLILSPFRTATAPSSKRRGLILSTFLGTSSRTGKVRFSRPASSFHPCAVTLGRDDEGRYVAGPSD